MTTLDDVERIRAVPDNYADKLLAHASAVSWGAIFAGAAAAAALSLILLILGIGLGMSSISPWANEGVDASTFGWSTILWLSFTQLAAAGVGGYLAGRLRTKWAATHTDEVYFRDSAHGFLAWAVATLVTAALLTSTISAIVGGGVRAGAEAVGGAAASAVGVAAGAAGGATAASEPDGSMAYFVDALFRRDTIAAETARAGSDPAAAAANQTTPSALSAEASRIVMNSVRTGALPPEDLRYLGQLVAQRTGMPQQEAEKRVNAVYANAQAKLREAETAAKSAADEARKASAYAALWIFVSLLIGAFTASWLATCGGRQRDI